MIKSDIYTNMVIPQKRDVLCTKNVNYWLKGIFLKSSFFSFMSELL